MPNRIEVTAYLSKSGFNAFLLNEIADIKATQLAIMDGLAELLSKTNDVDFESEYDRLNKKRHAYIADLMKKIMEEYGAIPDPNETAS